MKLNNFKVSKNLLLEILGVAIIFLILIGLEWRIVGIKESMPTNDTALIYSSFYPIADSLLKGHFPYWNPYINSGEPHFIIWQLSFSIRPTVFIWLILAKIFNLSILSTCYREIFTVFIIFCLGCYLFFRKIFKSKISAYIAFVVITFSSLSAIFWWQFAFIMTVYTLPWVLLFTFKFLEGDKKSLIPLAFFIGISLLGIYGMFFIFYYVILMLALWLTGSFEKLNIGFIKQSGKYFLFSFLILFLIILHLLPQLSYKDDIIPIGRFLSIDNASRISSGIIPTFEALKMSFHANFFDFFGLFFPHFSAQYFSSILPWVSTTGVVVCIGLIPLIFLFIGLLWGNNRYKWGIFFSTAIIMLLMLGTRSFILQFAYYFFPKFSWIQNMGMFLGFFIFNLCFFVGLGVDKVMNNVYSRDFSQIKKYLSLVGIFTVFYFATLGLLTGVIFLLYSKLAIFKDKTYGVETLSKIPSLFSSFSGALFYTVFFLFIVALFFFFLRKDEINLKTKIFFLIFFIIADLLAINYPLLDYTTQKRVNVYSEHPTESKYEDFRVLRINDLPPGFLNFMPSVMLKKFSAYSTTEDGRPTNHLEFKDGYNFRTSNIPSNIKNIILGISAPRLRLLTGAVISSSDEANMLLLEKSNENQIKNTAFLEEKIPDKYSSLIIDSNKIGSVDPIAEARGNIKVVKFDYNRLETKVSANQNLFLYYSDSYDKYWEAYVDGKKTKIYKTDLAFKSIILPAGEHMVEFIYNPWPFKVGLYSYIFVLISFGLWGVSGVIKIIKRYFSL